MKINTEFFHELAKKKYLAYVQSMPEVRKEQVRTYATVILTVFAFSFFGMFAISPTLSTIANLRKQLEDSTFINKQLDTKLTTLTSLQQNYNLLTPNLPVLMSAIPQSSQVPSLLGQIQTLAIESGVSVSQIKAESVEIANAAPSQTPDVTPFQITIEATGTYAQLLFLYQSLISFERLMSIDSITINRTKDGTDQLRLSLKLSAYYKP